MEVQDNNSMAIGLHTNIHQISFKTEEKQFLENGCSNSMTQLTQASRTLSNHFLTPQKKQDQIQKKRRYIGNISYKRKIFMRELKKQKPITLPTITKKIQKKFDLTKTKAQFGTSKLSGIARINTIQLKNISSNLLSFSERVMLYQWILQSCQGLKLSRNVFHLTISLIENITFFKKSNAQFVATACLYTQAVLDDRCNRPIEQFQEITQGYVSVLAIQHYQLRIFKDQNWQFPRISIIDQVSLILQQWDKFVISNPKLIILQKSQKCMFFQGKFHVQNYVQLMAIIDSLKIMNIVSSKNCDIVVFSLLVVFIGLELGYLTLQSIRNIRFQDFLPYQIIKIFVKQKFEEKMISPKLMELSLKKMYKCISLVMGILITAKPSVLEEIESVKSGMKPKFQFSKQFYFQGMLPK